MQRPSTPAHRPHLPIGLIAAAVLAASVFGSALTYLFWKEWLLWSAYHTFWSDVLRFVVFAAPVLLATLYGVTGLVGLYHRWASRAAAYADKEIAHTRAKVQIAPLATSFTYHAESAGESDLLELAPPIATTLALEQWMVWIDEQPHTLLAGKTKAGKTHLATAILERRLRAKELVFIIDPHSSNWLNLPTAGGVSNPKELKCALVAVLAEYTRRMQQRDAYKKAHGGQELPIDYFPRLNVLIDECNAIAAQETATWPAFATALASGSRKVGIALIILAQSPNVDDIGFSAKMRNNFAAIALDETTVQQLIDNERNRERKEALRNAVPASYPAAAQIGPAVWLLDRQMLAMGTVPSGALAQMWAGWDYAAGCAVPTSPSMQLPAPPASPALPPTQRVGPALSAQPVPTVQIVITAPEQILDLLFARSGQWMTVSEIASALRLDLQVARTEVSALASSGQLLSRKCKGRTTRERLEYQINASTNKPINAPAAPSA